MDAVAVGDNLTDAWRTIAPHLHTHPGADVLILGSGSIGLFAADIARACGAGTVRYVDSDPVKLGLASDLGVEVCEAKDFSPEERQYPITLNASADVSGATLRQALLATAPGGRCESTVFHFEDVALPLLAMHLNGVTLRSALSNARSHMPAVLRLLSSGRISPQLVITEVLDFDTAVEALPAAGFKPVFTREPLA